MSLEDMDGKPEFEDVVIITQEVTRSEEDEDGDEEDGDEEDGDDDEDEFVNDADGLPGWIEESESVTAWYKRACGKK